MAALALAGLVLAACGSSGAPSATSNTTTTVAMAAAGAAYLADVQKVDVGVNDFTKALRESGATTAAQAATEAAPAIAALATFQTTLTTYPWPKAVVPAITALIGASTAIEGDLKSIGSQTAKSIGAWNQQFGRDGERSHADANVVRRELGLPPASGTSPLQVR